MSNIVILSLWRNDADRRLEDRVNHLLSKSTHTNHNVRWVWIVGSGSNDNTFGKLTAFSEFQGSGVTTLYTHLEIYDDKTLVSVRVRSSLTATILFKEIRDTDDYVLLHESDLTSPDNIVDLLLNNCKECGGPVAGWPTIHLNNKGQFYDIWAYRHLAGERFVGSTKLEGVTEVSSFGSVWLAPAHLVKDRVIKSRCIVELCEQWRSESVKLFVDPSIPVVQPVDLWQA